MTAGDVTNPRPEPVPRPSSLIGNLKVRFRALAQAIMETAPAEPQRRKIQDQTRGGLMMAASRFMRHILRRQFHRAKDGLSPQTSVTAATPASTDYSAATAYLSDTLDWLNLWEQNESSALESDEYLSTRADYLYPHP